MSYKAVLLEACLVLLGCDSSGQHEAGSDAGRTDAEAPGQTIERDGGRDGGDDEDGGRREAIDHLLAGCVAMCQSCEGGTPCVERCEATGTGDLECVVPFLDYVRCVPGRAACTDTTPCKRELEALRSCSAHEAPLP